MFSGVSWSILHNLFSCTISSFALGDLQHKWTLCFAALHSPLHFVNQPTCKSTQQNAAVLNINVLAPSVRVFIAAATFPCCCAFIYQCVLCYLHARGSSNLCMGVKMLSNNISSHRGMTRRFSDFSCEVYPFFSKTALELN